MRKATVLAVILTFALVCAIGPSFAIHAMAQDSTKVAAPDTTKKVTPPPAADTTKKVTPTAPDTTKPKVPAPASTPVDTTKKVTPPSKPDTTKKDVAPKTKAATVSDSTKPATKAKEGSKSVTETVDPKAPYKNITFAKGEKPKIVMETTMGKIVIELWPDVAPKHCQSFVYLVNKGFYDSLTFHRIIPGFVIQGGDPLGNGTGGPGYTVPAEFSNKPHEDGVLSMARSQDKNSAGSQFFICLGRLLSLDNNYTVFGKVIEGLDVVHKIEKVKTSGSPMDRPLEPVKMTKVFVEKTEKSN